LNEALASSHQRVRRLRRLVQKRSLRWSEGVCVLEGPDLIVAALDAQCEFEGVYVDVAHVADDSLREILARCDVAGVRIFTLAPGVLERIADAQNPQPILAAIRFIPHELSELANGGLLVVLNDVRDPGNAGTVIRTADAAGAAGVIICGQSVDPYNPKTLRASAGSIFHVPVVSSVDFAHVAMWFLQVSGVSFATVVRGGADYRTVNLAGTAMIVVGNEADGLDENTIAQCDQRISIPMDGHNESLNVSIAAAIVLFEAKSQRDRRISAPAT
jgi:TrmH family RNA methyltransferase